MSGGLGPRLAERAAAIGDRARAIGEGLAGDARRQTSLACQRALLRAFGVTGLAPGGRPLAMEVVRRFVSAQPRLLRSGIALPFALAAHEYDLEPQQLALEVVAGHIDLAAEAGSPRGRARWAPAEALLAAWLAAADDRIDANRTARAELRSLLGDPPRPWLVVDARSFDARDASAECGPLVSAGADVVRVRVPRDGELRDDLGTTDQDDEWPVGPDAPPPAGSQRGIALLRTALDDAGARNGRYARLAARRIGLAAPELAVVAGFERVDVVHTDPIDTILELGVAPARAMVDHAFAQALIARSGVRLALGSGAPTHPVPRSELARASGRALALQAVDRAFALANGVPADALDLGAVPGFAADPSLAAELLAEVVLRAGVFPGHRLVVDDHVTDALAERMWPSLGAWFAVAPAIGSVTAFAPARNLVEARAGAVAAAEAGRGFAEAVEIGALRGRALAHADGALESALATLEAIERTGIAAALGLDGDAATLGADGLAPIESRPDAAASWPWGGDPAASPAVSAPA